MDNGVIQFQQVNTGQEDDTNLELQNLLNSDWSDDDAASLEPAKFSNAMFGFDKAEVMTYLKKLADFNEKLYQQNEALKDYLRKVEAAGPAAAAPVTPVPQMNQGEIIELRRQVAQMQRELNNRQQELQNKEQELQIQKEAYEEQQETYNEQIEAFREQYEKFQEQYGDYGHLEKAVSDRARTIDNLNMQLRQAEEEKESNQKTIDELMFLLEDNRAKLKELESQQNQADDSIDYATEFSKQIVSSAYNYATKIKRDAEERMNQAIAKMGELRGTVEGISKDILTLTVAIEDDVEDTIKTIQNTTYDLEAIKEEYIQSMNKLNNQG